MVAKLEIDNGTDRRAAVIRVFSSANRFVEVDAEVERTKLAPADRNDGDKIAAQLTTELQAKLDFRQLPRRQLGHGGRRLRRPTPSSRLALHQRGRPRLHT